jgi:hypothetical protein
VAQATFGLGGQLRQAALEQQPRAVIRKLPPSEWARGKVSGASMAWTSARDDDFLGGKVEVKKGTTK